MNTKKFATDYPRIVRAWPTTTVRWLTAMGCVLAFGTVEAAVSVRDFGAKGDGHTDDTLAFQKALNAAAATGDTVIAPPGQYLFGDPVTNPAPSLHVPSQVTLEGTNAGERNYLGYWEGTPPDSAKADKGTVFLVNGGANTEIPFLRLHENSALRGITFFYPTQPKSVTPDWKEPTPFPFTISMERSNGWVEDVSGVNPYRFIQAASPESVRCNIRRVTGHALFQGIYVDNDADIDRLDDIHFVPTWDNHPAMLAWMAQHSTAYSFYRADDIMVRNCFCLLYRVGFYFGASKSGLAYGTFHNISADGCEEPLRIDAAREGAGGGLVIEGGSFAPRSDLAGSCLEISPSNRGCVSLIGCRLWGGAPNLVRNRSQAGVVSLVGCHLSDWDSKGKDPLNPAGACIVCGDPDQPERACGKTRIVDCDFLDDRCHYAYTPGVAGVLFRGNTTPKGVHCPSKIPNPPGLTGHYIETDNF